LSSISKKLIILVFYVSKDFLAKKYSLKFLSLKVIYVFYINLHSSVNITVKFIKKISITSRAQAACHSTGFRRSFRIEAQGFQGGIWVLWHEEEIDIDIIQSHEQFVTVGVKSHNSISWFLTFIHGSPHTQIRDILWQELHQFATTCRLPWLLAGDFNDTTSLDERNHSGP